MLAAGQRKLSDIAEAVQRIDDADRQATALALAVLAAERPGWKEYLGDVANRLAVHDLYVAFVDVAQKADSEWVPHRGDLCCMNGEYYALVVSDSGKGVVTVRVSNGVQMDVDRADLIPVWISAQGACSNFAEEMKPA